MEQINKGKRKYFLPILILFLSGLFVMLFFQFLSFADNKYRYRQQQNEQEKFFFTEKEKPLFLAEGWRITEGLATPEEMEKNSSLSDSHGIITPYPRNQVKEMTYQTTIQTDKKSQIVILDIPEIYTNYILWINNKQVAEGHSSLYTIFEIEPGETTILLQVTNQDGGITGITVPPSFGTVKTLAKISTVKLICYTMLVTVSLTLALFSLSLWRKKEYPVYRSFGYFCFFFCVYAGHYFVMLSGLPYTRFWNAVKEFAFYGMIWFAVSLVTQKARLADRKIYLKLVRPCTILLPFILVGIFLSFPYWHWTWKVYQVLQGIYQIFVAGWLIGVSFLAVRRKNTEAVYLQIGSSIFAMTLFNDLLHYGLYSPIYTISQMEWGSFFMVVIFAAMIAAKNCRILEENIHYSQELSQMVEERTAQLNAVLKQHRENFPNIAHDLKAPILAIAGFIEKIRQNEKQMDEETEKYLQAIEERQIELENRIQSLLLLNRVDNLDCPIEQLSVNGFLKELKKWHEPEAEVVGIHFVVEYLKEDRYIFARKEKLKILFENLIYNALSFTRFDGKITISPKITENWVQIAVTDTGVGIAQEDIPRVFCRFFSGREDQRENSGIGLTIVKTIIEEMGGEVTVDSTLGKGACFTIKIPVYEEKITPKELEN